MYIIRVNTTSEFFKVRNEITFQYFNLYEQLKFMLSWVEDKIVYPQAETINKYVFCYKKNTVKNNQNNDARKHVNVMTYVKSICANHPAHLCNLIF